MFASLAFVFLFGLMGAAVFEKMKLPRIIGMLLVGIRMRSACSIRPSCPFRAICGSWR